MKSKKIIVDPINGKLLIIILKQLPSTAEENNLFINTIVFNLSIICIIQSARPKTADPTKQSSQSVPGKPAHRPTSADHQKQVKFATEEVVNELRQPPKNQTSRHVAHKEPLSPVAIVNMSPSVTKEIIRMEEHPSRGFKYAVVTPAIAKMPNRTSRSGETNANKGTKFFC